MVRSERVKRTVLMAWLLVIGTANFGFCDAATTERIWSHGNLMAWTVAPFDSQKRSPAERAQMLARLGITKYGHSWRPPDVQHFDDNISALKQAHIELVSWALYGLDNPYLSNILEAFRRQGVHPQLWVMDVPPAFPETLQDWLRRIPGKSASPDANYSELNAIDRAAVDKAIHDYYTQNFPQSPQAQEERVRVTTMKLERIANAAAAYGGHIALYNHNGWLGDVRNQIAVINHMRAGGITNVGIVYNFTHARDQFHDDSKDFPELWSLMKSYVLAVNVSGMSFQGQYIYPSQGNQELMMMQTIEQSGWRGPIGLDTEMNGDAEQKLKDIIRGVDWLAAEISTPGSGGQKPFPAIQVRRAIEVQIEKPN